MKQEYAENVAAKVKEIMENVAKLRVPIKAEVKIGKNWGEMK